MPCDASHPGKLARLEAEGKVSAFGSPARLKLGPSLSGEFAIWSKKHLGWRPRLSVSQLRFRFLLSCT